MAATSSANRSTTAPPIHQAGGVAHRGSAGRAQRAESGLVERYNVDVATAGTSRIKRTHPLLVTAGAQRQDRRRKVLALAAGAALAFSSCTDSNDPLVQQRDTNKDKVRAIAEALLLPPGYQRTEIQEERALLNGEGGPGERGGSATVHFGVPPGTTTTSALETLDPWFLARGFVRVSHTAASVCTDTLLGLTWGNESHVLDLQFQPGIRAYITIPYQVAGLQNRNSPEMKSNVAPPVCASG